MTPRPLEEIVRSILKAWDNPGGSREIMDALMDELRASLAEREKLVEQMSITVSDSSHINLRRYVYIEAPRIKGE